MKITICNSAFFWDKALEAQKRLQELGHEAITHPMEVTLRGEKYHVTEYYKARKTGWDDDIEKLKEDLIRLHMNHIKESEGVLVLNYEKNDIKNYVGGNTLIEMGVAFALDKKLFMLNPAPEEVSYAEEIKGMRPKVVGNDLRLIK